MGKARRNAQDSQGYDAALGQVIRRRRTELGLTQAALAQRLGITFQQVQKYEYGRDRVAFSRFMQLCSGLEIDAAQMLRAVEQDHDERAASVT
mgnify:CR=1 FL=1